MQFSDQFIAVLNAICEKLGLVVDWTVTNVVPYLQELIRRVIIWQAAKRGVWLAFLVGLTITCFANASRLRKKCIKDYETFDPEEVSGFCSILLYICGFCLLVGSIGLIASTLQIVLVPEIWFLNFARGYLSSNYPPIGRKCAHLFGSSSGLGRHLLRVETGVQILIRMPMCSARLVD